MARVIIKKGDGWSLWREGTGPGRCEGVGFKSKKEAVEFAAKFGHTIVRANPAQGGVNVPL